MAALFVRASNNQDFGHLMTSPYEELVSGSEAKELLSEAHRIIAIDLYSNTAQFEPKEVVDQAARQVEALLKGYFARLPLLPAEDRRGVGIGLNEIQSVFADGHVQWM
ncbi:MAG: hypothetical protein ACJAQ3_000378, partial [Planctomycetota bacterium]